MSFTAGITITANVSGAINPLNQVSSAIKAAQAAATQGSSGFSTLGNAARTAGTSVQSAGSGFTSFGGAVRTAQSSQQGFTSGLGQMSSAASSGGGAIKTMESAVSNSATTVNNANTAQKFFGTTLTNNGTAAAATGTKFNALGQVVSTNADAATKTSTSFGSLNNAMGQTATATEKTASSTGKFSAALGTSVGFMGTAISGGVGLFETFESLERAQVKVEQASTKLGTAQIKETSLQNQLNKMIANGDTSSAQYVLTQQKLEEQHNKVQVAEERLGLAQNDLNVTYADFAKNIIPEVIQVTTSMIAAWANMRGEIGGLKAGFSGFVDSIVGAGSGMKNFIIGLAEGQTGIRGFGTAMKAVILNPFVLGLTAVAIALLAIHENAFGTRDALNTVGKTVGDMNPIIALIVDSIKSFGIAIGLIPGNANEMTAALHKDVNDIGAMFEGLKNRLLSVRLSDVIVGILFAFAPGDVRQRIADTYVEPFIQGIASIPAKVTAGAGDLAAKIWAGLVSASKPITDAINWLQTNIIGPITSAVLSIGSRIQTGSTDLVAIIWQGLKAASKVITDALAWLQTYIVAPITSAVLQIPNSIKIGAVDLVAIIWTTLKAGSKVITDALKWLADNIFNPIVDAINNGLQSIGGGVAKVDLVKVIWEIIKATTKPITDALDFVTKNIIKPIDDALGKIPGFANAHKAWDQWAKDNELGKKAAEDTTGTIQKQSATMDQAVGSFQKVNLQVEQQGNFMRIASDGMKKAAGSGETLSNVEKKVADAQQAGLDSLSALIPKYADLITVMQNKVAVNVGDVETEQKLLDVYAAAGSALQKLTDENTKADNQIRGHNALMQESVFTDALKTKGVNDQIIALQTLQDKNVSETAALGEYARELQNDTLQDAKFTEGVNAQSKAMMDTQAETAKMQGQLQQLNNDLASGSQQWVSYQSGLAKADLEFANATAKMSESQGELQSLDEHLANGSAQWLAYHQGIVDADIEFDKFITTSIQAASKQDELNTKLTVMADAFGGLPGFIEPTVANLEAFNKAGLSMQGVLQDGGAAMKEFEQVVQKSFDEMTQAGDAFFKKLVDASGKSGKEAADAMAKAWDELPPAVGAQLDEADRMALNSAAQFAQAGQQAGQAFALKLMAGVVEGKPWEQAVADARTAAQDIISQVEAVNPQMAAAAQKLFDQLGTASASEIPKILAEAQKIPGPIGEVANQIATAMQEKGWTPSTQGAVQMATDTKAQITSIPQAAQQFGTIATLFQQQVEFTLPRMATNASTGVITAFNTMNSGIAPVFGAIGTLAQGVFDSLATIAQAAIPGIITAFGSLQGSLAPIFGSLGTLAQQVFQGIVSSATSIIPTAVQAFATLLNGAKTQLSALQNASTQVFNAIVSSATSVIPKAGTAFTTMATTAKTQLNAVQTAAKTAFDAVAKAGESAGQRVSAAMQKIGQSAQQAAQQVKQLASAIDALHDKTVTITVNAQGSGLGYLQHGGIVNAQLGASIRGGSKAFVTNRQMHYGNAIIGEHGKPELVLPLTKRVGDLGDKQIDIPAVLRRLSGKKGLGPKDKTESEDSKSTKIAFISPPPAAPRGQQGGERRDLTIKGKFQNDIPLQINIDGRKFMTMVQRQLLEFQDAAV